MTDIISFYYALREKLAIAMKVYMILAVAKIPENPESHQNTLNAFVYLATSVWTVLMEYR
jgi:hypothetical protein